MRYMLAATMLVFMALSGPQGLYTQASKKLKERPEDAQKKSWEQVDRINREADGTRSRNEQARKSAGLDKKKYTGGNVTKPHILPETKKSDRQSASKPEVKTSDEKKQQQKKRSSPPKK